MIALRRRTAPSDLGVVLVAVGAVVGALRPAPVPIAAAVAVVAAAGLVRRTPALVVAVALLASALSAQAWAGLQPLPPGPYTGRAELVGDPVQVFGGWQVDARTAVGRVELTARGGAGGRLGSRPGGAHVEVVGRIEPLTDPERAATRHVRARLVATEVVPIDDGAPWARVVEAVRGLVTDGAGSLPESQRALFTGFVLGDDRGMPIPVADDFDAAGLAHLLVVSGQNVAFVVAVAAPALSRLRLRGRVAATLGILLLFAAVTRFEPSVLRATAMAALATVATGLGRPAAPVRILALAVTGLVLVDPLLVTSLGFGLSCAACAGIVLLARPLAAVLPGPRPVATVGAVTLAAQAGVAPLLVPTFGPLPVVALPANLLAEPVAGLVMMWGCTAGLLAGVCPDPVALLLHLPTRAGLWWVAAVARVAAVAPLGRVGLAAVVLVGAALAAAVLVGRRRPRWGRALAALAVLALLVVPRAPSGRGLLVDVDVGGARLSRGAGVGAATVLVVPGNARADAVLAGLREHGVRRLELVVLRSPGRAAAAILDVVGERYPVEVVWAPAGSPAPEAVRPPGTAVEAGGLSVATARAGERLDVTVTATGPSG